MGLRANPRLIGGFVIGGGVLAVLAVFMFSGANIFSRKQTAVAFFDGSVAGLNVGSPVTFRGVRVGYVKAIQLRFDPNATGRVSIPVYMEFEDGAVNVIGSGTVPKVEDMVERGLRARLTQVSFVTGQLMVELNFVRGGEPQLSGIDRSVPEVPTLKSSFDQVRETLESLPVAELAAALTRSAVSLEKLLATPEIPQILANAAKAADSIAKMADTLNEKVDPLASEVQKATQAAAAAADEIRRSMESLSGDVRTLLKHADTEVVALSAQSKSTLKQLDATLKEAQSLMAGAGGLVAPGSPQRYDLDQILRNLAASTRALKAFAETLERNPNALLVGRKEQR
ncbi:MlaD family protein [Lacibacterium aquatile]|uniref:MlaD family protein n=1 Tax=Lacibacterium aquatile TaxID=1168082 RepID=A0ABW5DX74_9PROT